MFPAQATGSQVTSSHQNEWAPITHQASCCYLASVLPQEHSADLCCCHFRRSLAMSSTIQVEWTLLGGNEALLASWHCVPTRQLWKDVRTHLLDTMAFQYTRNRRTSECCISSSKNISTLINSLQRHHLNNQI